jgi:trigger factor
VFEVKKELLDTHEALLDVTIEEPTVQEAMRKAARQIARQVNIPGFRKGKAPYSMVVRYAGESAVLQEAADNLLEELYPQFIESAEITPYASGNLENIELNPLVFKIRVPLRPTVVLGDYTTIRKPYDEPSVSDSEIEMVLSQMREENAIVEPVDRPAEMGDEVKVNIKGTVNGEVVVDEDDIDVVFAVDRPFLSYEFQEALLGITNDEERTFTVPLPEGTENPDLRGAETEFTVKATQVSSRTLPGLDDAFASTVGAFETLEELQQDIYDRILQSKRQQSEQTYHNELVEMLVKPAEVHYPPLMVEEALDDMLEETGKRIQRERQMSLEDALRLEGRTVEQFREGLTEQAENRVKTSLVLAEFARVEQTAVTDDDVVQEYQGFFNSLNLGSDKDLPTIPLDSDLARNIRSSMLGRKALERLEQIAKGLTEKSTEEEGASQSGALESGAIESGASESVEEAEAIGESTAAKEEDASESDASESAAGDGESNEAEMKAVSDDVTDEESSDNESQESDIEPASDDTENEDVTDSDAADEDIANTESGA